MKVHIKIELIQEWPWKYSVSVSRVPSYCGAEHFGLAITMWGAKRKVQKYISKIKKEKIIEDYEMEI